MPARGEKEEAKDAHGIRCVPLHRNKSLRGDRLAGGGKLPVSSAGRAGFAGGGPIKSTNPETLRLLTDIRDFGFSLRDAERVAALLKKEQEAADGTM